MGLSQMIQAEMDKLNPEQRKAVETLDGPVLVVAGPGTGKTQLLSLRVVNLLEKRDISPSNILCLTYTEAGAEAMTKRLVGFIGRDAYDVGISTFHGFASSLRSSYPEFFPRSAFDDLISDLQATSLINSLLNEVPVTSPLFQNTRDGVNGALGEMKSFISQLKRSGLSSNQFRLITQQSLDFMDYVAHTTKILDLVDTPMNTGKAASKQRILEQLEESVMQVTSLANKELREPLISTPGVYLPFASYLADEFARATLFDPDTGRTTGFTELRNALFAKDPAGARVFKDEKTCYKALAAIDVFESYQAYLQEHGLYDFDDMILDAIGAIEQAPELRYALQDRYLYIQVDEYQDTNGVQMKLIDLLTNASKNPNVLVVGDDDQAIMRFQGASVAYINQFEQHYPSVKRCVLKTNYRSTPSLVELGQTIARQIEYRSPASKHEKDLVAHKTEDSQKTFTVKSYPTKDLQYFELARAISERIAAGFIEKSKHPHEAIAVIAPVHASLRALIPYLNHFGVVFNYTYSASVSQVPSLQTLLAVLRCTSEYSRAKSSHAEAHLPQILASVELGFSPEECIGLALAAKQQKVTWMQALKDSAHPEFVALYSWLTRLAARAPGYPLRQLISEAAEPLQAYYRARDNEDPFALLEFNYALKALLDFVEGELLGSKKGLLEAPLRLPEFVDCFSKAQRFGVTIDASIPISRNQAITLSTAHSSKGLEYDLVYLLDTDDSSWHPSKRDGGFLSKNMLFGANKDEDDARRLLFVAATRARYELEAYRGKAGTVRELHGILDELEIEPSPSDIEEQSEQSWQDNYRIEDASLMTLLKPELERMKMSASRLNAFVEYQEGGVNSSEFVTSNMLQLPETPSFSLAFGSLVHAFLEEYLNHVVKSQRLSLDELADKVRGEIRALDFEASDREHGLQRFERILELFVPQLDTYLEDAVLTELWVNAVLDDIPLVGKCDLLVLNETEKTLKVYDFKTALKPPGKNPSTGYVRQLQFYRLLLENSPEFRGWKVVCNADLYVEPMKDLGYQLCDPVTFSATDEEIEHLRLLVQAVWHRIQNGLFDTSAFEASEHFAAALAANVNKDGTPAKRLDRRLVQSQYEQWLIDEWKRG